MAKWTEQEQREWAENLTGYEKGKGGRVTQNQVKKMLWDTASAEEGRRGFDREDIRAVWAEINRLLQPE